MTVVVSQSCLKQLDIFLSARFQKHNVLGVGFVFQFNKNYRQMENNVSNKTVTADYKYMFLHTVLLLHI